MPDNVNAMSQTCGVLDRIFGEAKTANEAVFLLLITP